MNQILTGKHPLILTIMTLKSVGRLHVAGRMFN